MTETPVRSPMRRIVASSFAGAVVEYYDFLLYATASAVVFNKVFFTDLDPVTGTIASFGTFATGYLARPVGGIVFGHLGDRLGRKRMLIVTLTMMGLASTLIGCLPTYGQIGAAAPILLTLLRVVQGVAVGGEWGGGVLIAAEHATSRRGLWASFTIAGAPGGMVLSTVVMALVASVTSDAQFVSWGWRLPWLLSAVLVVIALWIRLRIAESPLFTEVKARQEDARAPLVDVLRTRPGTLLLSIGVAFGAFVVQSTLTTYLISYGLSQGFDRPVVLNSLAVSSAVAVAGVLVWSSVTDRIGRRPVVLAGAIGSGLFAFAIFPMVDTGNGVVFLLAVVIGQAVLHAAYFGPLAALMSEVFHTRSRYSGASLGYQIGGLGAGLAPLIFASLQKAGASTFALSAVIAAFCLVSVICLVALGETSRRTLTDPAPVVGSAEDAELPEELA